MSRRRKPSTPQLDALVNLAIEKLRKAYDEPNIRLLTAAEIEEYVRFHCCDIPSEDAVRLAMGVPLGDGVARLLSRLLHDSREVRERIRERVAERMAEDGQDEDDALAAAYMRLSRTAEQQGRVADARACLDSVAKLRGLFTENRKIELDAAVDWKNMSSEEALRRARGAVDRARG